MSLGRTTLPLTPSPHRSQLTPGVIQHQEQDEAQAGAGLVDKAVRVVPGKEGGLALLTANQDGVPVVIRTNVQGEESWSKSYAGKGEPTDLAVLAAKGEFQGFAFVGHHGDGEILDGHLTKLTPDGEVAWVKSFGDPVGGVGKFSGLGAGSPKLIYDECWGIQATADGGMITGCGTGIEGCDPWPAGSDIKKECEADPRTDWRAMITRFDANGDQVWQRVDSFQPVEAGGEVSSSACEYVALTANGGVMSVVDEAFGVGVMVLGPEGGRGGGTGGSGGGTSSGGEGPVAGDSGGCRLNVAAFSTGEASWWSLFLLGAFIWRRRCS